MREEERFMAGTTRRKDETVLLLCLHGRESNFEQSWEDCLFSAAFHRDRVLKSSQVSNHRSLPM